MKNKHHLSIAILALLPLSAPASFTVDYNWINTDPTGDWAAGSNWDMGNPPPSGKNASVSNGFTAIADNVVISLGQFFIGADAGFSALSGLELINGSYSYSSSIEMGFDGGVEKAHLTIKDTSKLEAYDSVFNNAIINLSDESLLEIHNTSMKGISLHLTDNSAAALDLLTIEDTTFTLGYLPGRTTPYITASSINAVSGNTLNVKNVSSNVTPANSIGALILTSVSSLSSAIFDTVLFDDIAIAAWTEEATGIFSGTKDGFRYELDYTRNGNTELWLTVTTIPEPSTYGIVGGMALLGMALLRRRKAN